MRMKNLTPALFTVLTLALPVVLFTGCTKDTDDDDLVGNWALAGEYRGDARSEAVCFLIGNKAYVGTGYFETIQAYNNLFFRYNLTEQNWESVSPFPGAARRGAASFVVNGKAYVVGGLKNNGTGNLDEVHEFDPAVDDPTDDIPNGGTWTQLEPFKGGARRDAIAWSMGNKGYIASGYNTGGLQDLWEFDPTQPAGLRWKELKNLKNRKRSQSVVFVIDNKAYVVSGFNNDAALADMQVWDGTDWTVKRTLTNESDESYDDEYTSITRYNAVAFVMNGKGYITTGKSGSLNSDTWEYDPATDLWVKRTAFEGTGREGAVSFTWNNRGFVLTGRSGSSPLDDMYEFFPNAEQVDND